MAILFRGRINVIKMTSELSAKGLWLWWFIIIFSDSNNTHLIFNKQMCHLWRMTKRTITEEHREVSPNKMNFIVGEVHRRALYSWEVSVSNL